MEQKSPVPTAASIIFFDGTCNLCNGFVDYLIRADSRHRLRYAPLQGSTARQVLGSQLAAELSSVVYWKNGRHWTESDAVLRILSDLGGAWPLIRLLAIFPRSLRDALYRFIATNRYRWFGRRDSCRLPTPEERALFLD